MENTLLVQTLSAFTKQERLEIKEFLGCRCFFDENSRHHAAQISNLFILLDDWIEEKKVSKLSKKNIADEIARRFPPFRKPGDGHLNNLMTELMTQLGKFIFIKSSMKKHDCALALARFYRQHGNENRTIQLLERIPNQLNEIPCLTQEALLMHFWCNLELFKIKNQNNTGPEELNLNQTLISLTLFYTSQILHLATIYFQQKRITPTKMPEWKAYIIGFRDLLRLQKINLPGLEVYDMALPLLFLESTDPVKDLRQYREAMQQHSELFPDEVIKALASYARNFCAQYIPSNPLVMNQLQFLLYEEHLAKGWLYEDNRLHYSILVNMVTIGLRLNKHEWVQKLLADHEKRVVNDNNGVIWRYCEANYHFYSGDFEKADKFKPKPSDMPEDMRMEKIIRILSIKITYEVNNHGVDLEDQIKAFREFLRRKHELLTKDKQEEGKKFAICVMKLYALNDPNKKLQKNVAALLDEIKGMRVVAEREWLEKKALALLKTSKK